MPLVAGDGGGNVIVIWRKRAMNSTRFDLVARRFTGGNWGGETKIETIDLSGTNVVNVFFPVVGMNGSSVAVAAWYYGGVGVNLDVHANVFRQPRTLAEKPRTAGGAEGHILCGG